jgi:hypothetical protein
LLSALQLLLRERKSSLMALRIAIGDIHAIQAIQTL